MFQNRQIGYRPSAQRPAALRIIDKDNKSYVYHSVAMKEKHWKELRQKLRPKELKYVGTKNSNFLTEISSILVTPASFWDQSIKPNVMNPLSTQYSEDKNQALVRSLFRG